MNASSLRSIFRKTAVFTMVLTILVTHSVTADAKPRRLRPTANNRYAAITMDAQTGRIIDSENPDKRLYPASITKLMTLFLTFESIQRGRLYMDKYLTISANATRQPPTKLGVKPGDRLTVKQAILALITRSANDAAVVLAENIGGSEAGFAMMMNKRAQSLGMSNTHFMNPSGLPNGAQLTTVRDIAILSRALMQYFPNQYPLFATRSFIYKREVITNHNHLMDSYDGMDGLKTGFTNASGFNLAASAVRNNRRLIVVVFGGKSASSRDAHVADLMNQGFAMLDRGQQKTQMASRRTAPVMTTPQQAIEPVAVETASADETTETTSAPETFSLATPSGPASSHITPVTTAPPAQPTSTPASVATPVKTIAVAEKPVAKSAPSTQNATRNSAGDRAGWVPDGGHVRPLQLPADYQQPAQAQQITPVAVANSTPADNPSSNNAPQQAASPAGVLSTTRPAQYHRSSEASDGWGIQVGAYMDVAAGQQALQAAQQQLGGLPPSARGVIVPSNTPNGTVYRARILGLSSQAANQACARLNDCMIFSVR